MIETDFLSYKASLEEETKTKISEVKKTEKYLLDLNTGVAEILNLMDLSQSNAPLIEKLKTLNFSYAGRIKNLNENIYKIELSDSQGLVSGHIFLSEKNLVFKL